MRPPGGDRVNRALLQISVTPFCITFHESSCRRIRSCGGVSTYLLAWNERLRLQTPAHSPPDAGLGRPFGPGTRASSPRSRPRGPFSPIRPRSTTMGGVVGGRAVTCGAARPLVRSWRLMVIGDGSGRRPFPCVLFCDAASGWRSHAGSSGGCAIVPVATWRRCSRAGLRRFAAWSATLPAVYQPLKSLPVGRLPVVPGHR
jgi:hypothetical protein